MNNIIEEGKGRQIISIIYISLMRYFRLVIFILVIIIFLLGYFFFIQPKYKSIVSGDKKFGIKEDSQYAERQAYLRQLQELKSNYEQVKAEDIKRIKTLLPTRKYHEELLVQLEKIILDNGLLLTSLSLEEGGSVTGEQGSQPGIDEAASASESDLPPQLKKLNITMEIVGADYIGLKNILGVLENNLRLIDIVKVSADVKARTTSLEAYAYYLE